jgi:hypothetical protein
MPECVEPGGRQLQTLKNLIQLASHVPLAERRTVSGREYSPAGAFVQVFGQHRHECGINVYSPISALRFDGAFLPIPDATANADATRREVQIIDVQPEGFTTPHPCTGQGREQHSSGGYRCGMRRKTPDAERMI